MLRTLLFPMVLLTACAPAVAELDKSQDDGAESTSDELTQGPDTTPEEDGSGDDGSGGDDSDGDDTDPEPVEPLPTLSSGEWVPTGAGLEDDPCGWDDILSDYYRVDLFSLLPSSFAVRGEEGTFEIEANDYGAAGDITCTFEDAESFTCQQQEVTPTTFDLGDYGWRYTVDFFGRIVDEDIIVGEAIVGYPSADDYTNDILSRSGVRLSDCTQTFSLELQLDD